MSQWQLSTGVCTWLYEVSPNEINGLNESSLFTLQVLSIMLVKRTVDRYLIILSDGNHFIQAMLAPHFTAESLSRGDIHKHAIVGVTKVECHIVNGRRLILINNLHVVSRELSKIGSPRPAPTHETTMGSTSERPDVVMESVETANSTQVNPGPAVAKPVSTTAKPAQPARSTIPIADINHYKTNFTLKARVTYKSDIRTWSNARGEGRRFTVTLMDDTGEICATAFTNAVDEFYDKFEQGKVYYLCKVRVPPPNEKNEKYSKGRNPYELYLEKYTEVEECLDATDLPMIRCNFVPLSSLHDLEKDSICDVIGIITEVGPISEIVMKEKNRTAQRRDLTLVDKSLYAVKLTIWGKDAETFNGEDVPLIVFKGVRVTDFGGRSLTMGTGSHMFISPDIPEAHFLRGWYDNIGIRKSFQSYSSGSSSSTSGVVNRNDMRHINDILDIGASDKVEFSACATVVKIIDENLIYPACPDCNRKVAQITVNESDEWKCDKCEKTFPRPSHRYRIAMIVSDWSGRVVFTGFDQVGLTVLGKTAEELKELEDRNESEYKAFVARAVGGTYNFRCLAKQDAYNGQNSVKYDVTRIAPLDCYDEAKHLRDLLMQPDVGL